MTALTDREFHAELALYATTPTGLPAMWVQGECDTCGADGTVRITAEGLACADCYDADPEPYDPFDADERQDHGWGCWE